ncbi:MAG: methylcobamide--CoM methyltransferase [Chloroflexi bacterium]|nr:methylcobamide--CoM methyltransferase [Chloroflexota bacterium]
MFTTVVGNYPKIGGGAPNLRSAITQLDRGRITLEELHRIEDQVTTEVIQEQIEAGIDLVTDGHIRWDDGQTHFAQRIKGFSIGGIIRYFDTNTYYRHPTAESRLERNGPIGVQDFNYARAHSSRPVKAVLTGPYTLARLSRLGCYEDLASLAMDLAGILNQEARALEEAGATVIQFDEPAILKFKDDLPLLKQSSDIVTRGLGARTVLCTYFQDISGLAPELYKLPFDVFGLDFAWGPANYQLLDGFPADKELVMGLLDARNTRMESVEEVVEAVRRATAHVSLDRVQLSPSCGLDFLPRKNAREKLARLVEGARAAQEALG